MRLRTPLYLLTLVVALACLGDLRAEDPGPAVPPAATIDTGNTAWMLMSTGLVLFMIPGLALFYGGMVRQKNVLGTMMHSMVALSIVGLIWILYGYSLAFGTAQSNGWIGWDWNYFGLAGVLPDQVFPGTTIPVLVHCMFQGMFAIITPALISGALAERIKFGPYCLFVALWVTLIYCPLAHWVWAVDASGAVGWLGKMGAYDFAGGTVVHIAAGVSGLCAILLLRKRLGYPQQAVIPNSLVLTLTGAGLLWFGWFGFNGGSALAANGLAGAALTATQAAAATAGLSWLLAEWLHRGRPTALGLASGMVAGLVAITPAAGFVTPLSAITIGAIAGVVCYLAVSLKPWLRYDDSLDAFGVHGVGGLLGAVLTGVFCVQASPLLAPGSSQLFVQVYASLVAVVFAFVGTAILVLAIDRTMGFCLDPADETEGLDLTQHGEVGFDLGFAAETVPETPHVEPRAATVPPVGPARRFTVVVDGVSAHELMQVWSELCQNGSTPPPTEFKEIYSHVTTVQGNRFRFRDGDPAVMSANLRRLFATRLGGKTLRTSIEENRA